MCVAPTCTSGGYTLHECVRCGNVYTDAPTEATGHTPGEWIVDVAATETAEGESHIVCMVCGEELLRERTDVLPETSMTVVAVTGMAVGSAAGAGCLTGGIGWLILSRKRKL